MHRRCSDQQQEHFCPKEKSFLNTIITPYIRMRQLQQTNNNNNNNNIGEGLFQQLSSPTHSQQHQQAGTATNNSSTLSELLGNGIISPHGLFMTPNTQDSLNSLLQQNSNNNQNTLNHSQSQQSLNSNMCLDTNNISIEKLLQQVEMLNHQSNIVAPLPPNMNCSNNNQSHLQHTQQVTINMDTNSVNSTWKMNGIPSPSDTSPNNFNQTNLQLLQMFSQQNQIPQQPSSNVNIGMIDSNLSETSILQLLQSSLNNQRMVSKNQPIMLNGSVNPQQQVVFGSMNNHPTSSSSDVFSSSPHHHQASIIINPNDFSALISHSPQHALNTSSHQMQDLLKPVDLCASNDEQVHSHSFTSNSMMETSTLQQGSVEEMLGETSKSAFMNVMNETFTSEMIDEDKPQKGGKKKRTKKVTKAPSTNKKPTKKSKKNVQEISILVPQQHVQYADTSPSAILSISPNSNSNNTNSNGTSTPQNGDASEKKNEKFSRPLLKNETVLCENNKFKNNYFVFSGTPTGAGSRKKTARTHSISVHPSSVSQNGTDLLSPAGLATPTSSCGGSFADNSSQATIQENNDSIGSPSPQSENRWASFVTTLSEGDRHSLMQALLEAMVKK
ncbi:predicted protein [Naegleria gruberi]|uniref:Predicted protein n=1 Tax=Naegleria gruberi TaxID=5762 RepID=D2VAD5_NAEGR|nr:uncharacterized protein NAEGRDRAFT_47937 [Naegleria gruberi]EFC46411.1 predicted protein [Naegleria gruberi]|eukprot:XP_002679155.1 predicted protein [Naegleria gruberi strain NEG-M]